MAGLTPFSTVGPFFKLLVRDRTEGTDDLLKDGRAGTPITISGSLRDGNGAPVNDGLIEIWQADAGGRYSADWGFGRAATGAPGMFSFRTIKPGSVDGQAPHILVGVMARGIMSRCWTRLYFEGEPLNTTDPILQLVPADRRGTLIARRTDEGYRFDIVLQGERETVFFDA